MSTSAGGIEYNPNLKGPDHFPVLCWGHNSISRLSCTSSSTNARPDVPNRASKAERPDHVYSWTKPTSSYLRSMESWRLCWTSKYDQTMQWTSTLFRSAVSCSLGGDELGRGEVRPKVSYLAFARLIRAPAESKCNQKSIPEFEERTRRGHRRTVNSFFLLRNESYEMITRSTRSFRGRSSDILQAIH